METAFCDVAFDNEAFQIGALADILDAFYELSFPTDAFQVTYSDEDPGFDAFEGGDYYMSVFQTKEDNFFIWEEVPAEQTPTWSQQMVPE
jgi:hypothetical protein